MLFFRLSGSSVGRPDEGWWAKISVFEGIVHMHTFNISVALSKTRGTFVNQQMTPVKIKINTFKMIYLITCCHADFSLDLNISYCNA